MWRLTFARVQEKTLDSCEGALILPDLRGGGEIPTPVRRDALAAQSRRQPCHSLAAPVAIHRRLLAQEAAGRKSGVRAARPTQAGVGLAEHKVARGLPKQVPALPQHLPTWALRVVAATYWASFLKPEGSTDNLPVTDLKCGGCKIMHTARLVLWYMYSPPFPSAPRGKVATVFPH